MSFEIRAFFATIGVLAAISAAPTNAQGVRITSDVDQVAFSVGEQNFTITRGQDAGATLQGEFAKTSRPCPEFCIQPMIAAAGVAPLGELEVLGFLENDVSAGTALLLDARLPDWFAKAAIPAAVNVPFAALAAENPYQADILRALGAVETADGLDFSSARSLVIYDNGAWDEQATRAITALIAAGYPPAMIKNYRGGLEDWLHLGLSVVLP